MAILWQYFGYHKITITFMLARQNGTILAIVDSRYLYVGVVTFYVGKNNKAKRSCGDRRLGEL